MCALLRRFRADYGGTSASSVSREQTFCTVSGSVLTIFALCDVASEIKSKLGLVIFSVLSPTSVWVSDENPLALRLSASRRLDAHASFISICFRCHSVSSGTEVQVGRAEWPPRRSVSGTFRYSTAVATATDLILLWRLQEPSSAFEAEMGFDQAPEFFAKSDPKSDLGTFVKRVAPVAERSIDVICEIGSVNFACGTAKETLNTRLLASIDGVSISTPASPISEADSKPSACRNFSRSAEGSTGVAVSK